jgi:hypothetical protein
VGGRGIVRLMDHEQCEECGFEGAQYDDASLIAALQDLGPRWRAVLADAGPELRVRPEAETWSAIEYAAHSRDITELHVFGVEQALTGTEPEYPEIEADELIEAAAPGYAGADPEVVVDELDTQARKLAGLAAGAEREKWEFGITFGGARSTARRLLEHALHDSLHHVGDIERGLAKLHSR